MDRNSPRSSLVIASLAVVFAMAAGQARLTAQDAAASTQPEIDRALEVDGPPAPVAPETMARDDQGRVTVRAIKLASPLRLDGKVDEEVYGKNVAGSGLIQIEPTGGAEGTERIEYWILFDDDTFYIAARLWMTDTSSIVATEMRHDHSTIIAGNDNLGFVMDTFHDRKNGYVFFVNTLGGKTEGQIANERQYLPDWNGVWDAKVDKFEGGWSFEAAIPFKTVRYRPGREQVWGLNLERRLVQKNEISFLTKIPPEKGPGDGMMMLSRAGTIVGLEAPPAAKNIDVKPYVISDVKTDRTTTPRVSNDLGGDVGLDVKYSVTQNLALDLTYNTDFAQVEADEQQINLTRFNLLFPEKRDFFLENAGTFTFGGLKGVGAGGGGGGGQSSAPGSAAVSDTPVMFYSRRIGLSGTREVPLLGGGRLTGRVGRYSLGIINIQTEDEPVSGARATNFSVMRVKRDILRRSAIGLMYTGRSVAQSGVGRNDLIGADGAFTFFSNVNINTYWARSRTTGVISGDTSYRAQLDYPADRYGVQLEHLLVGTGFNPEAGFVRRVDTRRSYAQLRFSPRPKQSKVIRKLWFLGSAAYIENTSRRVDLRLFDGEFDLDLHNSDRMTVAFNSTYEFIPRPFQIASGTTIPVGGYQYGSGKVSYIFGQQRWLPGTVSFERGSFYDGHRTTFGVSAARVKVTSQMVIEPSASINRVDLVAGKFTTALAGSRVTYSISPLMFVSALIQYNSTARTAATNVRLRWEYSPGSELFVVYNEQRDTLPLGFPDLQNRAFIIKVNKLFRF